MNLPKAILRIWLSRLFLFGVAAMLVVLAAFLPKGAVEVEKTYVFNGETFVGTVRVFSAEQYWAKVNRFVQELRHGEVYLEYDPFGGSGSSLVAEGERLLFTPYLRDSWWDSTRLFAIAVVLGSGIGLLLGGLVRLGGKVTRNTVLSFTLVGLSFPDFFVLMLLHFITIYSYVNFNHRLWPILASPAERMGWFVPLVALSVGPVSFFARLTYTAMDEIMHEDFIRTARSKGVPEVRVIMGHAFRNVLPRLFSGLPSMLNMVLSSLIVVEWLTTWPGLTRWVLGNGPEAMAVASLSLGLWYLGMDAAAQTLRLVVNARFREVIA